MAQITALQSLKETNRIALLLNGSGCSMYELLIDSPCRLLAQCLVILDTLLSTSICLVITHPKHMQVNFIITQLLRICLPLNGHRDIRKPTLRHMYGLHTIPLLCLVLHPFRVILLDRPYPRLDRLCRLLLQVRTSQSAVQLKHTHRDGLDRS